MSQDQRIRHSAVAFGLLAYIVTVGFFLLYWNAQAGGLVQGWYEAYVGSDGQLSGSGKWRTVEGKAFQNTALLLGLWIYPFSIVAAGLFVKVAFDVRGVIRKLLCLAFAMLAIYVVYRFEAIGLVPAITSF